MKLIRNITNDAGERRSHNFTLWFIAAGFISFLWVILRSGMNPKRLTYPCQQAAYPLASAWVIFILSLIGAGSFRLFFRKSWKTGLIALLVLLSFSSSSVQQNTTTAKATLNLPAWVSANPVSNIYLLRSFTEKNASLAAGNSGVPDGYLSDPAIDSLLGIMSSNGLSFYGSQNTDGIVDPDDIVIIKGSFQWESTLSTNTDRIKGLIWSILQHPGGFNGEILVCDNDQGVSDWDNCNNSNDAAQSIIDVVNTFKSKGYPVDYMQWKSFMNNTVEEYASGNMADGFTYNSTTKVSYPKFRTPGGKYISLSLGVYSSNSNTYDRSSLCLINFPVCKAHGYSGATLAIKNMVGVMSLTNSQGRFGGDYAMHFDYFMKEFALPARVTAACYPDLNIMDATWIAPSDNYTNVASNRINTRVLLASTDPVALSWYTAKFVLTPLADSPTRSNPDYVEPNPGSIDLYSYRYSMAFGNWSNYLIQNTNFSITRDSAQISVFTTGGSQQVMVSEIILTANGGNPVINQSLGTLQLLAQIIPAGASNRVVTWQVDNPAVASVNGSGLVTALSNGSVTVTATATDGSGISGNIAITVTNQNTTSFPAQPEIIPQIRYDRNNRSMQLSAPTGDLPSGSWRVEIIDLQGRIILSRSIPTPVTAISLAGMKNGIVVARYFCGTEQISLQKFMIQ